MVVVDAQCDLTHSGLFPGGLEFLARRQSWARNPSEPRLERAGRACGRARPRVDLGLSPCGDAVSYVPATVPYRAAVGIPEGSAESPALGAVDVPLIDGLWRRMYCTGASTPFHQGVGVLSLQAHSGTSRSSRSVTLHGVQSIPRTAQSPTWPSWSIASIPRVVSARDLPHVAHEYWRSASESLEGGRKSVCMPRWRQVAWWGTFASRR